MRSIFKIIVCLLLPLYSLAEEGFVIKGKVSGIISGYVSVTDPAGKIQLPPKVRIVNGEFTYSGQLDHSALLDLKISTKNIRVFLENTTYTIDCSLDSLNANAIKGGTLNNQMNAFNESHLPPLDYIKANPAQELSAWFAMKYTSTLEKATEVYQLLSPDNRNTWEGKAILEKINAFKNTGAGAAMPDLQLTAPDNKPISLQAMTGKIVVLDFWASWCAPCRAYIPTMREHYNKFKDKGVVFMAVSVDDNKEKWKEAMAETNMEWLQALAAGGFKAGGGVQEALNISSIPHVVIVGKDGRIAAWLDFYKKDQLEKELIRLLQ
ncbi:TlpA disulfide reductase family protein [Chitinophaga arvensicola]|uniref:Peroxiredoxin n=1 Tax=Chitinophaga arvensicola TaxID=29529 RepID=A0A1I0S6M4_9BACT|nr:TlpA disulfide reductase family protein [Chitinophaga arvensicola]SEW51073.1 Peroxiredoxin [Chitinophaga arvensicola]